MENASVHSHARATIDGPDLAVAAATRDAREGEKELDLLSPTTS
jgi:hypothetical protein